MSDSEVRVERSHHGPFERIVLEAPAPVPGTGEQGIAQLSFHRIGDVLIDAGCRRFADTIVRIVADRPLRAIALTHHHEDHAGGIAALRRRHGAVPVWAPRSLARIVSDGVEVPEYRAAFWGQPEPAGDVVPFDDGAEIQAGGVTLRAMPTGGHTPGHVVWVADHAGTRYVVAGDLVGAQFPQGVFFESAADDVIRACRRLAQSTAPLVVLPTHGRVRSDGAAWLTRAADWLAARADEVREASMRLGTEDPAAVAQALYGPLEESELGTGGEFSAAALVRSVLAPVRAHPVSPIRLHACDTRASLEHAAGLRA